jgi:hypothetical protein
MPAISSAPGALGECSGLRGVAEPLQPFTAPTRLCQTPDGYVVHDGVEASRHASKVWQYWHEMTFWRINVRGSAHNCADGYLSGIRSDGTDPG